MTKIYFGCDEIPRHWEQYYSLCNAIELDLHQLENLPRKETLNRWRVESPRGFAFILRVDQGVEKGLIRASKADSDTLSDEVRKGWEATMERAQALAARALLLRTPLSFSPGQNERALMASLAEELADDFSRPVIWEASGPWDTEFTREWSAERGLTFAFDPFLAMRDEIGFHHGDGAFVLSERAGLRREFDRYDVRRLADRLGSYNRAFFMLRGRFKWEYARHFGEYLEYGD